MVMTPIAPMPVHMEKVISSPGVMFAPEIQELETTLPRQVLNALEAIGRQMESEIFKPILHTSDIGQLAEAFRQALQKYGGLYISMSLLLWSEIGDIARLTRIWMPILASFKAELESRGAETIGEEAANNMLVGLATMGLVNRRLLEIVQVGAEMGDLKELQGWAVAYWMAFSCVFCYHFDREGNPQNVRVLAYWSRYYAARLYQLAKSLGIIKVPAGKGQAPETLEEDQLLAEAGLEDFIENLALGDKDES